MSLACSLVGAWFGVLGSEKVGEPGVLFGWCLVWGFGIGETWVSTKETKYLDLHWVTAKETKYLDLHWVTTKDTKYLELLGVVKARLDRSALL